MREKVKTTSLCFLCSYVRKRTYLCPNTAKVIIQTFLNTSVQWHIMRKKIKTTSLCSLCPYVKLDVFMPKHDKMNDWLVHLSTCQPANHCKLFGKKFNTKSGLFIHQLPTLPQKIDSREGLFWGKKGLVVNVSKMNTHCIKPQFAPHFGLFAAKCGAICR